MDDSEEEEESDSEDSDDSDSADDIFADGKCFSKDLKLCALFKKMLIVINSMILL